jgi:YbbR domain-containing protein
MENILDRQQILLTGPASVVDRIAMARIDVNYAGRDKTFGEDFFITLCDEEGLPVDSKWVEVDYSSVYLTSIIHQVRMVELGVEVVDGGGASADTAQITLSQQEVKLSGTQEDMQKLDQLLTDGKLVLGTLNLADYAEDTKLTFSLTLPEGIQLHAESGEVTVDLAFPDLTVMELLLQEIELVNIPEGMVAQVQTTELTVRIRGLKTGMDTLLRENLKAVVDMSEAKEGEGAYPAVIQITNEKLPGAGALGTYEVQVLVEAAKEAR